MFLWFCDSMILWLCDAMILWFYDKWPHQNFRLSLSCADAEARKEQTTCSTWSPIKVFVYGEASLLSKTNVCFCLPLKSQSRDITAVPLSACRHTAWWRCLWGARRLLGCSFVLEFSARTFLLWYSHSEKGSWVNGVLSMSPFSCPYFTGRFCSHLCQSEAVFSLFGFLPSMISESSSLAHICRLWNAWQVVGKTGSFNVIPRGDLWDWNQKLFYVCFGWCSWNLVLWSY